MADANLLSPTTSCTLRDEAVSSRLFSLLDVEGLGRMFVLDRQLAKDAMSSLVLQSASVIVNTVTRRLADDSSSESDEVSDNGVSESHMSDLSGHSSHRVDQSEDGLNAGFGESDFCSMGPWRQAVLSALKGLSVLLSREDRIRPAVLSSALRLLQHRVGLMEEWFDGGHAWKGKMDNMDDLAELEDMRERFGESCGGGWVEEVPFAESALCLLAQFAARDDKLEMAPLLDLMMRQPDNPDPQDLQMTILAVLGQVCQYGDEAVVTDVLDLVRQGGIWKPSAALLTVAMIGPRCDKRIVSAVLEMWAQGELSLVEALALLAQTCCRKDEKIVDVVTDLLQHVSLEERVFAKIRQHIVEQFIVDLLGFLRDHFDVALRNPVGADQNVIIVGLNVLVRICQCGGESIVDALLDFLRLHVNDIKLKGESLYYEVMLSRPLRETDAWIDGAKAKQEFIKTQLEPMATQLLQVLRDSAAGFDMELSEVKGKITSVQQIKFAVLCLSCRYDLGRNTQIPHDCSVVARSIECMSRPELNVTFKAAFCRLGVPAPLYTSCPSCSLIVSEALEQFSQ